MKTNFISLLVCVTASFAAAVNPRTLGLLFGLKPVLTQTKAEEIVNKFKSVLEGVNYKGKTPFQTTQDVVAENYIEYSDSIQSLISLNNTLGDGVNPSAVSRDEWYAGVSKNPSPNIKTLGIFVSGSNIFWYWIFPEVGIKKYPVKGFNLLRINEFYQIKEADIEFNSIAWGVDIFQIQQYCGAPPAPH